MSPEEAPSLHAPRRVKRGVDPGIVGRERRRRAAPVPYVNVIAIGPTDPDTTSGPPLDGLDGYPAIYPICQ
jgi:hypothetical protein